jgi:hypothetical protein
VDVRETAPWNEGLSRRTAEQLKLVMSAPTALG